MSDINETQVIIAGRVLTLTGYETAEYTQKVGNYINKKLEECKSDPGFRNQNKETQMLMLAINVTDDYMKIVEKLAENEQVIKDKDTEIYNLKHDIISTQQRLDKADEQVRTLQDKIADSSKKLLQLDAKLSGKGRKKSEEKKDSSEPEKSADKPKAEEPVKTPEPPKVSEPVKTPEPPKAAEPLKVPEPPKVSEPAKAPEPPKAAEPSKVPEPPKESESSKAPEPPKAVASEKAPEAPKSADFEKSSEPSGKHESGNDNAVGFRPHTMPRLVKDENDDKK